MPADKRPIPSVWARPHRQHQQPALSRERIVSVAVHLLDAEGIESLSMRRLGTRLESAATSLYRHVANKDELVELVVDEVYGEVQVPAADDPSGWRTATGGCARSLRSAALRHPWINSMLGQAGLAYLGPNLMRVSDGMLAVYQVAGFAPDEADQAMNTVIAYVIGWTTSEAAYLSMVARSGRSEQDLLEHLRPAAEEAVKDHPRLREGHAAWRDEDPEQTREDNFSYGLERVLDGLEARLGRTDGSS